MLNLSEIQFACPWLSGLTLAVPPLVGLYVWRQLRGGAAIRVSSLDGIGQRRRTWRTRLRHVPFALRCVALMLVIVALARPRTVEHGSSGVTHGIDIVLAMDISGSMLARDFTPDRIGAARETASKFIVDRTDDRIGIVVFAGESFTQSPLTTDKRTLLNMVASLRSGMIDDGTAIGNGLATAVNRVRESTAESKVIILLTDGVNNAGQIAPLTAAEIARTYGIRVYTIGIGTRGMAPMPAYDMWGDLVWAPARVEIDEQMLGEIASMTGGEYFRATDNNALGEVYDRINALEKTEIETSEYVRYDELYRWPLLAALAVLMLEFLIGRLLLRRIP